MGRSGKKRERKWPRMLVYNPQLSLPRVHGGLPRSTSVRPESSFAKPDCEYYWIKDMCRWVGVGKSVKESGRECWSTTLNSLCLASTGVFRGQLQSGRNPVSPNPIVNIIG